MHEMRNASLVSQALYLIFSTGFPSSVFNKLKNCPHSLGLGHTRFRTHEVYMHPKRRAGRTIFTLSTTTTNTTTTTKTSTITVYFSDVNSVSVSASASTCTDTVLR